MIGIGTYGADFDALPAVPQDLRLIEQSLRSVGYDIENCSSSELSNASALDDRIRRFICDGGPQDVRLIYFTGHGLRIDGTDYIIPAGVRRTVALSSQNQRVSTDFSLTVRQCETGLVVFVIDACRDADNVTKTKGARRDRFNRRLASEYRFVRLFGCAPNQVCQIVNPTGEAEVSLFTHAFAACLDAGRAVSLQELRDEIAKFCEQAALQHLHLQPQTPRIDCGEISDGATAVLNRPIFSRVSSDRAQATWSQFDPNKFHCLVVRSEGEIQTEPGSSLTEVVNNALTGATGIEIWDAFRTACNGVKLLSGARRELPAKFEASALQTASISVRETFASWESLKKTIRMIVEADLAVFDVTGWEPGVLVLLGIRAAARRWLSICSHGNEWREGEPLEELPFGLQDLNVNSHSPSNDLTGEDQVVNRFVERVRSGFLQAARQPSYLDLPCYDALRQLGPEYAAASTIGLVESVLFLCSYSKAYYPHCRSLKSRIKKSLWDKARLMPTITRIIDQRTSQLVHQRLYEQIRRTAACIVDWTELRPSVFFELGVRLASSEWGAVSVIDESSDTSGLKHVGHMHQLLGVIPYPFTERPSEAIEEISDLLIKRNPNRDTDPAYNRVYRAVMSAIGRVQPEPPPVVQQLTKQADALHHPEQGRQGAPQILYSGSREAKQNSERTALELRLAAWLLVDIRLRAEKVREADRIRAHQELGRAVMNSLYDLGDDISFNLAAVIEQRLGEELK